MIPKKGGGKDIWAAAVGISQHQHIQSPWTKIGQAQNIHTNIKIKDESRILKKPKQSTKKAVENIFLSSSLCLKCGFLVGQMGRLMM